MVSSRSVLSVRGALRPSPARRVVLLVTASLVASCSPSDLPRMDTRSGGDSVSPVVSVALGQRVRDVERRSTAPVRFSDRDLGTAILERDPAALAYADPAHAFTLPPGRFLRLDQAAGRLTDAKTTPHLDALTGPEAVALVDSVSRLLERAGWQRVPGVGTGAAAVQEAARFAASGNGGFGVTHVGTWRVPRPSSPWAALPPGTPARPNRWNGVEAEVTVRPVGSTPTPIEARLIVQVALTDELLASQLSEMVEARRQRNGGEMQTLSSWDAQPNDPASGRP